MGAYSSEFSQGRCMLLYSCWPASPRDKRAHLIFSSLFALAVVLAPIAAILCADFFFVKRGKYNVPELYNFGEGIYRCVKPQTLSS